MKNLDEYSKDELIEMVKSLKRGKKFGLVWEDKPEKVVTDCVKKLPIIKEVPDKAIDSGLASDLTNIIIEGDNYHALSVLNYTHAGKVDLIYIDPPYNTGAKDWKYNNNYIDSQDAYRHSKWLSLMANRLKIAKHLLRPDNSCLIVTIDENELLHLGCLLEDMFPEANMQMVTSVISPGGRGKKKGTDFTRTQEYIFFLRFGDCVVYPEVRAEEQLPLPWRGLIRGTLANGRGMHGVGACGPNQFYPIYVNDKTRNIVKIGDPIKEGVDRFSVPQIEGCTAVFPVRPDGTEMNWGCVPKEAEYKLKNGYLRVTGYYPNKPQQYTIQYLTKGSISDIEEGKAIVEGRASDGSVYGHYPSGKPMLPTTVWNIPTHNATQYGTELLKKILGKQKFDYPKSLCAVEDCLRHILKKKKDAIVLDFFAGSGTTGHAVMKLNKEDGGHRQFIICTNNENKIAEEVTYPRIKGVIDGYGKGDKHVDGLPANVRYFKTEFIDKNDTMDKLRRELSPACEDMIRVREGAYEKIIDDDMLKVFKNSRGLTAIIYDRFELAEHIEKIEALDTDAIVHLYVFSYSKSDRRDEMPDNLKHKYEVQPIPEGVLEIYKKIFANIKGGKNA